MKRAECCFGRGKRREIHLFYTNISHLQPSNRNPDHPPRPLLENTKQGGTLWTAIAHDRIDWRRRGAMVALDVAQGLHYFHARSVLHLDIKSANVRTFTFMNGQSLGEEREK